MDSDIVSSQDMEAGRVHEIEGGERRYSFDALGRFEAVTQSSLLGVDLTACGGVACGRLSHGSADRFGDNRPES